MMEGIRLAPCPECGGRAILQSRTKRTHGHGNAILNTADIYGNKTVSLGMRHWGVKCANPKCSRNKQQKWCEYVEDAVYLWDDVRIDVSCGV